MSKMDEKRPAYSLKAPGNSGSSLRLPGRGPFPRVDDHLVVPELTRDEIIGGRRVVVSPANPPHANQHTELAFVLRAHVAPGYQAPADLLTRHDEESDFATDVCIYKDGVDPETGTRYLEEIAFEVVSEQNERLATEKAQRMQRRGVRRIFAIWVKGRREVCEWSPETQSWHPLEAGSRIEDPCLVMPVDVAALLDAAAAENAVVQALSAKDNPAIRERVVAAAARSRAESILMVMEARGIAISPAQREEILGCSDLAQLDRWLSRAAVASSADKITSS
jgi:Putative restriction endonuclease